MIIRKRCILLIFMCIPFLVGAQIDIESQMQFVIEKVDYEYFNKPIKMHKIMYRNSSSEILRTDDATWKIDIKKKSSETQRGKIELDICFELIDGLETSANVGINFLLKNWNKDNYVLLPGAAYNGNRFKSRSIDYSPKLIEPNDIGVDKPIVISDVSRLEIGDGPSEIQERSGSMSIPSIGIWDKTQRKGFIILTTQCNEFGDLGINICENRDRTSAIISLKSPLTREKFRIGRKVTSVDKPVDFKKGDKITYRVIVYTFDSENIQGLFNNYFSIRKEGIFKKEYTPKYPYSHCYSILEEKFNSQNYVSEWGYYSVGMRENYFQDWQIGWTGGMISTYPLLFAGTKETEKRVLNNFDWLFNGGIAPSNLFWCSGEKGNIWYGGDIRKPHTKNWHLIRKSGDGLFYIIKQFDLMHKKNLPIQQDWEKKTEQVAQALVGIWKRYGQFGQFVDNITGEIKVGGSTSGAIIPGALALASKYYDNKEFMEVAESSAEMFYTQFVSKGITCGGPGDALQNPDSESSYSMLESFVTLYEQTGKSKWLTYAKDMAAQFATWVFCYDYQFPPQSTFGKLRIHANGSVLANTQNKHSAPGICTYSGSALFRLYRMTKDEAYLELLKSTAFNLPQYLSHKDFPISNQPQGWINERVNTTDWEGEAKIGEIFRGSTWAETSLLLTCIEIPSLYVDIPNERIMVFDNIEAKIKKIKKSNIVLEVTNPTKYEAKIKILIDRDKSQTEFLPLNYLFGVKEILLEPEETLTIPL